MEAKILNEIINAKIENIIVPDSCTYNNEDMIESSREVNDPVKIIMSNGEILNLFGCLIIDRT